MEKNEYDGKIKELESQYKVMKERYRILEETTPALLFEYRPGSDVMIFNYNFPENKSRQVIENYHDYIKVSPLVHPNHMKNFLEVLERASEVPIRGELEYLSRVSGAKFQWHKAIYSSIADEDGEVFSVLGRIQNIHESKSERQKMIHRVETDLLTGLFNKETAIEKISFMMKKNPTRAAQMVMIDLDNFKEINDIYGHTEGDKILKETARTIRECFPESCLHARFGGDEFVVFVMNEKQRTVEYWADMLIHMLPERIQETGNAIHCSVGIASRSYGKETYEDLFNRADNAMYRAKRSGKNCYCIDGE